MEAVVQPNPGVQIRRSITANSVIASIMGIVGGCEAEIKDGSCSAVIWFRPDIGGDDIRGKLATLGRIVFFRHVRPPLPDFSSTASTIVSHKPVRFSVVSTMNRTIEESGSHP